MHTCPICGGNDFDLQDGHYFCNECCTQSQEIREVEEDEDAFRKSTHRIVKTKSTRKAKNKPKDKGPQIYSCEGFNLILYHQVKALIQMGASPGLKDAVMKLWFLYLRKLEMAFTSTKDDYVPRLPLYPYRRDIVNITDIPLDKKALRIMQQLKTRKPKKCLGLKKKKKKKNEKLPNKTTESEQPANDEGSRNETEQKKKSSKFKIENLKQYSKVARQKIKSTTGLTVVGGLTKLWNRDSNEITVAERMRLRKTIAFCYVGLLLVQDQIIPGDIVRWMREEHIPYLNAYRLLPDDVQLQYIDRVVFKPNEMPSVGIIKADVMDVIRFCKIDVIPPQPVYHLAIRFIVDLNLPNEMASVMHRLVNVICPELLTFLCSPYKIKRANMWFHYDMNAACLLIIALKLVFGLDGKTERELSTYAKQQNEQARMGQRMFVWDDWEERARLKLNLQKHTNVFSTTYSVKDTIDVEALHSMWRESKKMEDDKHLFVARHIRKVKAIHKAFLPLIQQRNLVRSRANSFPINASTSQRISGDHEVNFFLHDFSSYSLPKLGLDNFAFVYAPQYPSGKEAARTQDYIDSIPSSLKVLLDCLSFITGNSLYLLARTLENMETKFFTLLGRA